MKLVLISLLSVLSFGAVQAESLRATVLAEKNTHVGFAPPAFAGTYSFQILSSGVVQKVDNKNNVTVLATLAPAVIAKFAADIEMIKSDELTSPDTPPCFDAPTQQLKVQQADGGTLTIWKKIACRYFEPKDVQAAQIVDAVSQLEAAFNHLEQ